MLEYRLGLITDSAEIARQDFDTAKRSFDQSAAALRTGTGNLSRAAGDLLAWDAEMELTHFQLLVSLSRRYVESVNEDSGFAFMVLPQLVDSISALVSARRGNFALVKTVVGQYQDAKGESPKPLLRTPEAILDHQAPYELPTGARRTQIFIKDVLSKLPKPAGGDVQT